jgi:hypothetical protein
VQAHEHLTTATEMYREMDMEFWVEKAVAKTCDSLILAAYCTTSSDCASKGRKHSAAPSQPIPNDFGLSSGLAPPVHAARPPP